MHTHLELYEWQKDCLKKWQDTGYRGIVDVVTGAGKTFFAITAAIELKKIYPSLRIKIVVPTIMLASQWQENIKKLTDIDKNEIGVYHGKVKNNPDSICMIYVVNSARNCIAGHILTDFSKGYPVLLIADECHHYASVENRRIFDFMTFMQKKDQYFSIGLSATPDSYENSDVLLRGLGPLFYQYDVNTAAADYVVSKYFIANIDVPFSNDEMDKYNQLTYNISICFTKLLKEYPQLKKISSESFVKEVRHIASLLEPDGEGTASAYIHLLYTRRDITTLASTRLLCAKTLIERLEKETSILVFCERIAQAEALHKILMEKYPSACSIYHSRLLPDARKRILSDFRSKRIRILISCRCLDEGMDVPDASACIVLSSTSTTRQRLQRLGRILRKSANKGVAALYYVYVGDSAESPVYLNGQKEVSETFLRYLPAEDDFIHPAYENIAATFFQQIMNEKKPPEDAVRELRTCIQEGLIRPDWYTNPEYCVKKQENVTGRHLKNYWLCMEKLSRMRELFS